MQALRLVTAKVRRIQAIGRETVHIREKIPRHTDGFFLEVIAERPVTQHLKEGVMVRVFSNIVQIVVLPACANALLRIRRPGELGKRRLRISLAQENRFVLIHARVCEEKRGVVDRHRWR